MDTEFLGDGILDEEQSLRPGAGGVDAAAFNLADAVILGNIDEDSSSFETSDSGFHLSQHLHARLYVSGRSQAAMSPDAVPARAQAADGLKLTPFEKHVLNFIDGKRPVEVIRKAAGLDEAEVKTALATLADKGVIKVVGRALSDLDFDAETVPKSPFRRARVRGSVMGAVALVGDEADRAIEEAFRTNVSLSPLARARPDGKHDVRVDDDDADAVPTGPQAAPNAQPSLPSDADAFLDLKGTDELAPAPAALRPQTAAREAVNRRRAAPSSGSLESADASLLDDSDGFDEFSDPSELNAAIVAPPSASDSAPRAEPARARGGVFADLSASGAPLPGLEELADSRFVARPDYAQLERQAAARRAQKGADQEAHATKGAAHVGARDVGSEPPSLVREREAASGDVWDSAPAGRARTPPPVPKPRTHDSSLSDLLSESPAEEATRNLPPEVAQELRRRSSESGGSAEEPTAAGQPMPPQLLPRVGKLGRGLGEATGRVPVPKSRSAMASMPDELVVDAGGAVDEHSGLYGKPGDRGAADALFDGDEDADREPPDDTAHRPGMIESLQDSIDASEELDPVPAPARPPRLAQERAQLADAESEPSASGARAAFSDGGDAEDDPSRTGLRASLEGELDDDASDLSASLRGSADDLGGDDGSDEGPSTADLENVFRGGGAPRDLPHEPDDRADKGEEDNQDDDDLFGSGEARSDQAPDDDGEEESAFSSSAPPTANVGRDSEDSTNDLPRRVVRAAAPPPGIVSTHAHSVLSSEATLAPSQAGDSASAPAPPPLRREAEKAPPPAISEPAPRRPAQAVNRRPGRPPDSDSSVELVDSALLIRPAAKVAPVVAAVAGARGSSRPRDRDSAGHAPAPSPPPPHRTRASPPAPESDDASGLLSEELEASHEATMNLEREEVDALRPSPKSPQVAVGRGTGAAAPIPSDLPAGGRAGAPRAKTTDEMRRKGRQLFEEAKKEYAAGKVGAARMNAKLASIYDPENEAYQAALRDWDEAGGAKGRAAAPPPPTRAVAQPPVSESINSAERQREIHAIYDEAQDFENQGDFDEALEVLYRGVDRYPNTAAFHNRIGVLLAMKKRDFDGAISSIQRAIELEPHNMHYKNNLGKVMQRVRPRA